MKTSPTDNANSGALRIEEKDAKKTISLLLCIHSRIKTFLTFTLLFVGLE
jgi:hypothetical protein